MTTKSTILEVWQGSKYASARNRENILLTLAKPREKSMYPNVFIVRNFLLVSGNERVSQWQKSNKYCDKVVKIMTHIP